MEKHPVEGLTNEALEQIRKMMDVNTVVGTPITAPDGTVIIPVSKVALGFGSGGSEFSSASKNPSQSDGKPLFGGASGGGVTITPVAFLVVNKDQIKLLPITKSNSTTDKIIDLVPDIITKFNKMANEYMEKRAAKKEKKGSGDIELV